MDAEVVVRVDDTLRGASAKVEYDSYHDDCGTKMEGRRCPKCNIFPDFQSITLKRKGA